MSRLEYASDNLQNVAQNTAAARSRVLDADYASETTELARTQIIQQAATAMLAQANASKQQTLQLIQNL
jgi:flagellin